MVYFLIFGFGQHCLIVHTLLIVAFDGVGGFHSLLSKIVQPFMVIKDPVILLIYLYHRSHMFYVPASLCLILQCFEALSYMLFHLILTSTRQVRDCGHLHSQSLEIVQTHTHPSGFIWRLFSLRMTLLSKWIQDKFITKVFSEWVIPLISQKLFRVSLLTGAKSLTQHGMWHMVGT